DLEITAVSSSPAIRLHRTRNSGVYEQSVEFEVIAAGRFALRVEGRVPDTTRPASAPTLPSQRRFFELRPRIFVEVLDLASRARGRVVFQDYAGAPDWPSGSLVASSF